MLEANGGEASFEFHVSSFRWRTSLGAEFCCAKLTCLPRTVWTDMQLSKEYVGYLAHQVVKRLIDTKFIETKNPPAVNERVNAALLEEITMEDRINDEVRVILEAYSDEMR